MSLRAWHLPVIALLLLVLGFAGGTYQAPGGSTKMQTIAGPTVNHTVTVIKKVLVTHIRYRTRTTVTSKAPTPPPPPAPAALSFSGNGGLTLQPFDLSHDATMYWTDSGGLMQIFNSSQTTSGQGEVNSQGSSGQSYVPAGHYALQVNSLGSWTITIN